MDVNIHFAGRREFYGLKDYFLFPREELAPHLHLKHLEENISVLIMLVQSKLEKRVLVTSSHCRVFFYPGCEVYINHIVSLPRALRSVWSFFFLANISLESSETRSNLSALIREGQNYRINLHQPHLNRIIAADIAKQIEGSRSMAGIVPDLSRTRNKLWCFPLIFSWTPLQYLRIHCRDIQTDILSFRAVAYTNPNLNFYCVGFDDINLFTLFDNNLSCKSLRLNFERQPGKATSLLLLLAFLIKYPKNNLQLTGSFAPSSMVFSLLESHSFEVSSYLLSKPFIKRIMLRSRLKVNKRRY